MSLEKGKISMNATAAALAALLIAGSIPTPVGAQPHNPAGDPAKDPAGVAPAPVLGVPGGDESYGPGPSPVDPEHPDGATPVEPAYGGSVVVHHVGLPQNLNYLIENTSYARYILYEVHEFLVHQNWETWEYEPRLASEWIEEDTLILKGGRGEGNENVVYGLVTEDGDDYVVTPGSPGHALEEPTRVPKADVESLERATVYTFTLREGVKFHDGHVLDAYDVYFSWSLVWNPDVDCDSTRGIYQNLVHAEVVDDLTVRFFYKEQYFNATNVFTGLTILPSHLYDLWDPANPDHDPEATPQEQAAWVNDNPHNTEWVGLGPYRVVSFGQEGTVAERFDDYFEPSNGGYFDRITWRHIASDDTAFQALINGDLDFLFRIKTEDYVGEATKKEQFTKNLYKGLYYTGGYNYMSWNMLDPKLKDFRVRKALAHCFNFEEFIRTVRHGLAKQVTGPQFLFGESYNHDVEPLPFDLDTAEELLAEAGWYDRDGDDIIDKDGIPFELEFLSASGSSLGPIVSQKLQENLGKIGIKLKISTMEWASFIERVLDKDFEVVMLAWSVPIESDPYQLWHSDGAPPEHRGSNHSSVNDPYVDELIEKGKRELDDDKRHAMWRELHRYLYEEIQPYLFMTNPPRKYGMNKAIRGFQDFRIDPGFSIRRWYYPAGTPGTRSTRER